MIIIFFPFQVSKATFISLIHSMFWLGGFHFARSTRSKRKIRCRSASTWHSSPGVSNPGVTEARLPWGENCVLQTVFFDHSCLVSSLLKPSKTQACCRSVLCGTLDCFGKQILKAFSLEGRLLLLQHEIVQPNP